MSSANGSYRLSCDIGGTFTDFYLIDQATGEVDVEKCLTTPADPSAGVLEGVKLLERRHPGFLANTECMLHATTLVINALIERKGALTGLVTTRGFRDVLEIGREMRYDLYDLFIEFPKPLVPRYLRQEVTERSYENGRIMVPLDEADMTSVAQRLQALDVRSIAVCFLHSYANPANERAAKAVLNRVLPGIPICISSDVLPEVREYERTTTTVANAYVTPLAASYVTQLVAGLRELGFQRQLLIMLSSGGMTSAQTAAEFPIRIVESGPAAGAVAAAHVASRAGYGDHVLAFDMGGTTAKGCVIRDGNIDKTTSFEAARVHRFKRGSGIPLRIPVVDLIEIGAGGGSIARVSEMGLIQVGPQSAGAAPGPACYDRGGQEPTVSDADLILGYLNESYFLGGDMRLNREAARRSIEDRIASRLDVSLEQAAWGIHEIVNENMAAAIRIHMAEKGADPSRFTLVAFGGGGPVHAFALAKRLGTARVLIPPSAGIASAFGLLVSPISFDLVRTHRCALNELDLEHLTSMFAAMEAEGNTFVARAETAGEVTFLKSLDICYVGQTYSVNVPLPGGDEALSKPLIRTLFEKVYEAQYGRVYHDMDAQLMNLRLVAQSAAPKLNQGETARPVGRSSHALKGTRLAYSGAQGKYVEHAVYDRYKLASGVAFRGPAIIEERESTTVVDDGGRVSVDDHGALVISLEGGEA